MPFPTSYSSKSVSVEDRLEIIEHILGLNIIGNYASVVARLAPLTTLLQELHDDHATFKTAADAVETAVEELIDDHATLKSAADSTETAVEELIDDHATFKSAADSTETAVEELVDDHATFKTAIDQTKTAVDELIDDHATFKTAADGVETLIEELHDDHATFITVVSDIKTLVNDIRTKLTAFVSNGMLSSAQLAIGSSKPNVATGLCMYTVSGIVYSKAAVAAGTAPGNDVIPQNKYGACALDIGADGTIDATEATANATGYDSAVLAAAGIPAVAADHVRMGYVTAMKSDGAFTFGTTELDAANTTVAYTSSAGVLVTLGAAVATSAPATLAATKPASAPVTLTASKPSAGPATLTASKPTSAPTTLTATKPTSAPATLTASKPPSAPATLTAAKPL